MFETEANWIEVSELMNRPPLACRNKWKWMQTKKLKKGPFTAEEDAIIRRRKAEWGDRGIGLWTSLGKELGRPGPAIGQRWKLTLKSSSQ